MKRSVSLIAFLSLTSFCWAQPVHPAFGADTVHEIRLTFAQSDFWEQLTNNFSENEDDVPYIEASLEWGPYKFDRIGARFKGNSSYRGATTDKKPFRLKLNEYVKGQKIEGIASFNLNNSWNDPSFVREKIYFEMAAAAGMKTPRMNYAALYINGKYWGLYFLGEVINGDFLDTRFPDQKNGNLYKANIGGTFEDKGDDPAPYKEVFEKKSNETDDNWTDLVHLVAVLNRTSADEFPAAIEEVFDVDSFLKAMALDNLTVNLDNYAGMSQNYYIYRRPSDNKFEWLVWDPSLAFGALGFGLNVDQMKTLPLEWSRATAATVGGPAGPGGPGVPPIGPGGPGNGGGFGSNARPLLTRIWDVPAFKDGYNQAYCEWLRTAYVPDPMLARMSQLRDLIRPWLEKDPNKLNTVEQFEAAMTQDISAGAGGPGGPGPGGPGPIGPGLPPGGPQGGGLSNAPGLDPFVKARLTSVQSQLASRNYVCP